MKTGYPRSLSYARNVVILASSKAPQHDTGGQALEDLPVEVQAQLIAYQAHQEAAPKMGWPTEIRTLVQYNHGFAVMSTHSKSNPGYPGGSVVGFAPDGDGRPLFIFSGMSTHTQDLLADPRCSVTIAAKEFKGAADGRVNLMGKCELIRDPEEKARAKEIYVQKHPGAFWVDFGDFNWCVTKSLCFVCVDILKENDAHNAFISLVDSFAQMDLPVHFCLLFGNWGCAQVPFGGGGDSICGRIWSCWICDGSRI